MERATSNVYAVLLAVAISLASASGVWAETCARDGIDRALIEARNAHERGRLQEALATYRTLARCMASEPPDSVAAFALNMADTLAALDRHHDAIEQYTRALAQPGALSSGDATRARQTVETLKARMPASLSVECHVPDLRIALVDHSDAVSRPCPARWDGLSPGRHGMQIIVSEAFSYRVEVRLRAGQHERLTVDPTARLSIAGRPLGATVVVDGAVAGVLPLADFPLAPGPHRIGLLGDDGRTATRRSIDLRPGEERTVELHVLPVTTSDPVVPRAVPWVAMGLGWGAVIGSGIFLGVGESHLADAHRAGALARGSRTVYDYERHARMARDSLEDGKGARRVGYGLLGVGASLVVGSLAVFVFDEPPAAPMASSGVSAGSAWSTR